MAPVVGSVAGAVGTVADVVQYLALGVTALSGGTSGPVTVPIAIGAEYVGIGALGVQASADFVENGNFDKTGSEVAVKVVAGGIGYKVANSIDEIQGLSKATEIGTKAATNAIASSVINTSEKVTNSLISNYKNDKSLKKTPVFTQSVSLIKLTVTDNNHRN
ncbi:MAG: hypothetical protein IPJ13_10495 [Saprospiraceae bacterium]|nr:hypothetical protein [Saprospiraceae bacterium]